MSVSLIKRKTVEMRAWSLSSFLNGIIELVLRSIVKFFRSNHGGVKACPSDGTVTGLQGYGVIGLRGYVVKLLQG